jgi:glycosyltransferase involved in cell wall biosynthesis
MTNKIPQGILIAVPVYNESRYIARVITEIKKYARSIVVIDDGSTDGSGDILSKHSGIEIITHETNLGYGRTIIDSFNYAMENNYKWLITIDCDLQHEPEYLGLFYEKIKTTDADIISGSRYLKKCNVQRIKQPYDRKIINKTLTAILNNKLSISLTDSFCGFKAYKVPSLKKLTLTETGYAFPIQFIIRAVRAGIKIVELPVPLIYIEPDRCFGEGLDDPNLRFNHYLHKIYTELDYEDRDIEKHIDTQNKKYDIHQPVPAKLA